MNLIDLFLVCTYLICIISLPFNPMSLTISNESKAMYGRRLRQTFDPIPPNLQIPFPGIF